MPRFSSLALLLGSILLVLFMSGGCASSQNRDDRPCHHGVSGTTRCDDCWRENVSSQSGWNCVGCKSGQHCSQHPAPTPPPPVVIEKPCSTTTGINMDPLLLRGTARFTVIQTATGKLEVVDCDGNVCPVDENTVQSTSVVEVPIEATANLHGAATLTAKPGEPPCDKKQEPKKDPAQQGSK